MRTTKTLASARRTGRPPKAPADLLDRPLGMRISRTDEARLDAFLARTGRITTRHGLARRAMLLGLELLERDPARLLEAPATSEA
jgi:hypothetical protein